MYFSKVFKLIQKESSQFPLTYIKKKVNYFDYPSGKSQKREQDASQRVKVQLTY